MNRYERYYFEQAKSGIGGGYYPHQAGHGLGSFFGSIWRSVYPYLRSGFRAVRDELVNSGVGIIKDGFSDVPIKDSLANRVREFGTNLSNRASDRIKNMSGSGKRVYKRRTTTRKSHCATKKQKRSTPTSRKNTKKRANTKARKPTKRLQKGAKKTSKKISKQKRSKKKRTKTCKQHKGIQDIFS
jgi:hypothetical protein